MAFAVLKFRRGTTPTTTLSEPYYNDAPALTEEQTSQNTANTHRWSYVWNEANTTWDLTDALA